MIQTNLSKPTRLILSAALCALASAPPALAAPRTVAEAKSLAQSQLSISRPNAVLTPASAATTRSGESDNFFVFDIKGNNGYVIVSADDRFEAVLGYADSGSYADAVSNPAFEGWLNAISLQMASASSASETRAGNFPNSRAVNAPDIAPLLKTKWGQNAPYNNDCWETGGLRPSIGWTPGHAPTGCVATAMAQVMHYHQWPPAYTTNSGDTYDYKWDLMLPSYDGSESEEAIDQVAKLMKHCGESVNMSYTSSMSGASSFAITGALVNKFGYDASTIRKIWRESYGYDAIHSLLYTELQEGRPIIAGGEYPGEVGHEFVLDGCNSDGFFHVNWGWDGYCDGYFRLSSMRPADYGTGGSQEGFNFNMDFTIGIQPALSEANNLDATLTAFGDLSLTWGHDQETVETNYYNSMEITVTTINGRYKGFMNTGTESFNGGYGDLRGKLFTKLTNLSTGEETICPYYDYIVKGMGAGYYTDSFTLYPRDLEENTPYKVTLVYTNNDPDVYKDVQFSPGCRSYLIFEREGDVLKITKPAVESSLRGDFPADFSRLLRRGAQCVAVSFSNPGDTEYLGQVKWKFTDAEGNPCDKLTDYVMVNLPPGASTTEDFYLYKLTDAPAGAYTVALYDFRDRMISAPQQVELYDYRLELTADNFPDAAFRRYIADNFDKDSDGALSDAEIADVNVMKLDGIQVTDLSGIDRFFNLYNLSIKGATFSHFQLPVSTRISQLEIYDTPLESISLAEFPDLDYIRINNSNLRELDLSPFKALYGVDVDANKLERLILPATDKLRTLYCSENLLEELDLSGVDNLYLLYCHYNNIKALDISNLKELIYLSLSANKLESLDLSGLEKLQRVGASSNAISDLRLGTHPQLTDFTMSGNPINGPVDLSDSPGLQGIYLDHAGVTELKLPPLPDLTYCYIYNNDLSGLIDLSQSQNLKQLNAEANPNLQLKLGSHPLVENIWIEGVQIADNVLDLSEAVNLVNVDVADCGIKSLILGDNNKLTYLRILRNEIEGILDISGLTDLRDLMASDNNISLLRHSSNPALTYVSIDNNALTHFHADDFPALATFYVNNQAPYFSIATTNFNTKTISGFEPERASDWWAEWDYDGEIRSAECSVISGVVRIPEEAGRDLLLHYSYLTDAMNDKITPFTITLTREGFNSIDDLIADGSFSITGNSVTFAEGINGALYTTSGLLIHQGSGQSAPLAPGIYIIRIAGSTIKVTIP